MEKLNKIIVLGILPVLLISSQSALGHTLNDQICEDIGLLLDSMNNICVADFSIVCLVDFHGDSIGGGFVNIGTDQFGNECREVHPSDPDLVPPLGIPPSFLQELLPFIAIGILILVGFVAGIIFLLRRRK